MLLFPDLFLTKENTDCFCYHKFLICSDVRDIVLNQKINNARVKYKHGENYCFLKVPRLLI
jgi:hypothetical protein